MKKRIVSLVCLALAACLLLSGMALAADGDAADTSAGRTAPSYTDIAGHWAERDILTASSLGFLGGASETLFAPDSPITRAELIVCLYRLYALADETAASASAASFTDVPAGSPYETAVNWAAASGIVKGSGGLFRPDDPVSREEFAVIFYRFDCAAKKTAPQTGAAAVGSSAPDAASVSAWAAEAMNWALGKKLLAGMTGGLLCPKADATRAQTAAVLVRYFQAGV
mgnify:CR=1 FL=1